MLAIARFSVPAARTHTFIEKLRRTHQVLAESPGYRDGEIGQSLDDPTLWVLVTRWENVGSYRRALNSTTVKLEAIRLSAEAIDEPGAFDLDDGSYLSVLAK